MICLFYMSVCADFPFRDFTMKLRTKDRPKEHPNDTTRITIAFSTSDDMIRICVDPLSKCTACRERIICVSVLQSILQLVGRLRKAYLDLR